MQRGFIYARISSDPSGEGLGVERQLAECRALADRLGIEVTGEYVDNDISASSGRPRPHYAAMLEALRSGTADVVLAYNLDRLYRRMRDLEDYIDIVESRSIQTHTVIAGSFDLNTPMGRAIARNAISFATLEVDQLRVRVKSAKMQAAQQGRYSGGPRPFGYEADGVTVREAEATAVRAMVEMAIRGKSWNSIAIEMNRWGVRTSTGREWRAVRVQNLLASKRYIGVRSHNGTDYPAAWPAILSDEDWLQLRAAAVVRRALYKKRGTFRINLLVGYTYCGACGARLVPGRKQQRSGRLDRQWRCLRVRPNEPDGCGKVSRLMDPIDDLVGDAIVYRLNSREVREALAEQQQAENHDLTELLKQESAQLILLDELLEDRASGVLNRADYVKAKTIADGKLDHIRTAIARHTPAPASTNLPVALTREGWDAASLEWKRSVVDVMIEQITVLPSHRRHVMYKDRWVFDPGLIEVTWRV